MSDHRSVQVAGTGGHAKVVVATLFAAGWDVQAAFDDDPSKWGQNFSGITIQGATTQLSDLSSVRAIVAIGDNFQRRSLAERYSNIEWVTVIHPHAYVHPTARIGKGTVVFAGSVIQPDVRIGNHCIINTGATIDHDCLIGEYVHVAPGSHLGGGIRLGLGVLLGIGSVVLPSLNVGDWTTIGAGSAVVKDLPAKVLAFGVPAVPIKNLHILDGTRT